MIRRERKDGRVPDLPAALGVLVGDPGAGGVGRDGDGQALDFPGRADGFVGRGDVAAGFEPLFCCLWGKKLEVEDAEAESAQVVEVGVDAAGAGEGVSDDSAQDRTS